MKHSDTIVARATNSGQSAVSVIRISGSDAFAICDSLTNGRTSIIDSHEARLRKIMNGNDQLDEALVTVFRAPNSYTGEDTVEISLHGSDYITSRVLQTLMDAGARMAEPGEFTLRSYLNGKLDLAQAEAVADLIAAQSGAEHNLALNQLKGNVSGKIKELRERILEFAALVELELDFGEEDVEFADRKRLKGMVEYLMQEVLALLESFKSGNAIREGIPVAIVGKPNAGKSTLLNSLVGEERAIVTDIPGTTRDTIEEVAIMHGLRFRFIDTAGIREAENLVEKIGIERTFKSIEHASLVWLLIDVNQTNAEELEDQYREISKKTNAEIWILGNKVDVANNVMQDLRNDLIPISAKNHSLDPLLAQLKKYSATVISGAGDTTISNARHYEVLQNAMKRIRDVLNAIDTGLSSDKLAHHMREAMKELGRITGDIDNEEILGQIFSKFCIGK